MKHPKSTRALKPRKPERVKRNLEQPQVSAESGERVHKVLAHAGIGSRRQVEQWVRDGRVKINGRLASLGDRLTATDTVHVNGRPIDLVKRAAVSTRVLLYHKAGGELVSRRDPEGRPVIFTQLPKLSGGRWIAVGRLDINTQGLLVLTNNGELAHRLMHPSFQLEREYAVRVFGRISDAGLKKLSEGVLLEDGPARFDAIQSSGGQGANKWFRVVVGEGHNRVVRRLWESQGVQVSRLIRIRYGPLLMPENLKARTCYELSKPELNGLLKFVESNSAGAVRHSPKKETLT